MTILSTTCTENLYHLHYMSIISRLIDMEFVNFDKWLDFFSLYAVSLN